MTQRLRVSFSGALLALLLLIAPGTVIAAWAQQTDPGAPGTFAVSREEYSFGDAAFIPESFADLAPLPPVTDVGETQPRLPVVEMTGSVFYPTDLSQGPFPLLVFLHGRHSTAYDPATGAPFLQWPPQAGRLSIPSYNGYDYVARILASHGYVVVSISANGINARDNNTVDRGMLARAELMQRHLDLWRQFSTTGAAPFGDRFAGKVDMDNIGTMGHSRGGEGVVRHYLVNAALGTPYKINAVLPLAPVDFNRPVINNVPLLVMLPYCDGDVSDLQGAHFFDDARYNAPGDASPKFVLTVMGAIHNFYNTFWTRRDDEPDPAFSFDPGGSDDWMGAPGTTSATSLTRRLDPFASTSVPGNKRLTPAQERGTAIAYFSAFFRTFIGGERAFLPLLTGDAPPPASASPPPFPSRDYLHFMYHAPDAPGARLDLNRLLTLSNLQVNTLGGSVGWSGLAPYDVCGGEPPQPVHCLVGQPGARQPHTTPSLNAPNMRGLSQLRLGWSAPGAFWTNALPPGARDLRAYAALQFRAAVNFQDYRNMTPGAPVEKDFSVVLTDGAGRSAATLVSRWSDALFYPPGKVISLPKVLLHSVRIPLQSAFGGGIDLSDVRSVTFRFDRQNQGALLLSDLAFCDPAPVSARNVFATATRSENPVSDLLAGAPMPLFSLRAAGNTLLSQQPAGAFRTGNKEVAR